MKKIIISSFFSFWMSIGNQVQASEEIIGVRPQGICTRDINAWGNPSRCHCPNGLKYNEKAKLCFPQDIKLPKIIIQGKLNTHSRGEFIDMTLEGVEQHYGLILTRQKIENLRRLNALYFEVQGELFFLSNMAAKTPAVIVEEVYILE